MDHDSPTVRAKVKSPVAPGQTLGRYRLLEELGRGGMGVVFLAEDSSLHRRVAVKLLSAGDAVDAESRARFEREARAMAKLSHRNVVAVHDFGFHDGAPFIVMELIRGSTLRQWLAAAPRTWREIVAMFLDAGRGLAAAHAEGIVHRDFKPENVLVAADGRAVVTDFGIARDLVQPQVEAVTGGAGSTAPSALTGVSDLIGTPRYMAPEQFTFEPISERVDQFAFGITLYEALCGGVHPFLADGAEHELAVIGAAVVAAKVLPPPAGVDFPAPLLEVVRRLLQSEPAARFDSMGEVLAGLESLTEPPPRRRRAAVAAAATLLALVAAGLGAWQWRASALPSGERSISLSCSPEAGTSELVTAAACRLAQRQWCQAPQPYRCDAAGNVPLELRVSAVDELVKGQVFLGQRPEAIAQATGASAVDVVAALAPGVRAFVGEGRVELPPALEERAAARDHGAKTAEQLRRYQRVVELGLGVVHEDLETAITEIDALVAEDPGWAHPWAMKLILLKVSGPRAEEAFVAARAGVTDPKRDPGGSSMLTALEQIRDGKLDDAVRTLREAAELHPRDPLLGWLLMRALYFARSLGEAVSMSRLLTEAWPELQFGFDQAELLFETGRHAEQAELATRWLSRAPANEEALRLRLALAVERGDAPGVRALGADYLLIHGQQPRRWTNLCDALIEVGLLEDAHAYADRLVAQKGLDRIRGLERDGMIAVYEGRFLAARQAFAAAVSAHEGELDADHIVALDALAAVQRLIGEPEAARATLLQLAEAYVAFRDPGFAATVRYELELEAKGKTCPAPEPLAAELGETEQADALTGMRRAAAAAGCGECDKVLRPGFAPSEHSTSSLVHLGQCAAAKGQLRVAEEAFTRAVRLGPHMMHGMTRYSPVQRMLARFHLAGVLEKLGRPAEAATQYETFLSGWGVAEAQVPQVREARAALAKLSAR